MCNRNECTFGKDDTELVLMMTDGESSERENVYE